MNQKRQIKPLYMWWRIIKATFMWWYLLIAAVVAMIGFAVSNLAMVYLLGPVLSALFNPESATLSAQLVKFSGSETIKAKIGTLLAPILYKQTPLETLKQFAILLVIIILIKNLFQYIQNISAMQLMQNITNFFRKKLFEKILTMPLGFFHRMKAGELMSRVISDVQMMQESISVTIADLIRDPLQVVVYYAFLLTIDSKMTLYITVIVPLIVIGMSIIGKHLRRYGARTQEKMAELASVLQEGITGIRVVKGFNAEKLEASKFKKFADKYLHNIMKMYRVRRLAGPFNELIGAAIAACLLWFGGRKVILGVGPSPAEFMQYILTLFLMMQPIKAVSDKVNRIQQGLGAASRVFWLLDLKWVSAPKKGSIRIKDIKDGIKFEHVWFKYDESENYALKDLTFEIPAGSMVALVGHSGAGKSTTADILSRFYTPQKGKVLVDGIDLAEIEDSSWRALLGIVSQEVILFNDTVSANISYGDPNPDTKRIYEAAKAANALEFIEKLPQGFNTIIGERGLMLSGGERQRIAIARAIYRNPKLLILDEATSALDTRSEMLVQQAIDNLISGRTVLVIAHRLSTVLKADKIIVLEKGEKICEGNHEELYETCEQYREIYDLQFGKK